MPRLMLHRHRLMALSDRIVIMDMGARVQQNVRKPLFEEGQVCGLVFPQVHWYAE